MPLEDEVPTPGDQFGVEVFGPLTMPVQMRDPPPSEYSDSSSTMFGDQNSTLAIYDSSEELDELPFPEEEDLAPTTTAPPVSPPSSEEPLMMAPEEEVEYIGLSLIPEEEEEDYSTPTTTATTSTTSSATESPTTSAPPTPSRGAMTTTLENAEIDDLDVSDDSASLPVAPDQDLHFWLEVFRVARWPILVFLIIMLVGVWILGGCAIRVFGKPCLETGSPLMTKPSQAASTSSATFYTEVPAEDPAPSASASTTTSAKTLATASTAHISAATSESPAVVPKSLSLLARRRQSLKLPVESLNMISSERTKPRIEDLPRTGSGVELDTLNLSAAFSKLAMARKVLGEKKDSCPKESDEGKGEKEKPKK